MNSEDEIDPEHEALMADSVGLALLVVLDTLRPRAEVTSTRFWQCSTQMSCSEQTPQSCLLAQQARFAV
jgi:hypothetical protein